jgi:hypothetical protein
MRFDAQDLGEAQEGLGYIIENRILQCALFDRVKELEQEGKVGGPFPNNLLPLHPRQHNPAAVCFCMLLCAAS